ncbi:hypothetical protein [Phenylobacterium sp.]|uniref:hypothetical protein n=1 Tax=Phenylobacterium sp. TaxID=1871053 RepID=UPI00272F0255|nr:hypothetical protein [Phenylobacterium sp.]MDP1617950.1 hypothetical protein [Phenylobacterium sp.]MDP1985840.1 hypothetical protein [Phenylobacterium sp.]
MCSLAGLALTACAPPAPEPVAAFELNCAAGFDAIRSEILARPGVKPAPDAPGEPYEIFNEETGRASYILTRPQAPAHPAVFVQTATRRDGARVMEHEGCAFGDVAEYDQLLAYWESLAAAR